jgi:hypothetical protein
VPSQLTHISEQRNDASCVEDSSTGEERVLQEREQRAVGESWPWLLARNLASKQGDDRLFLERLGFTILDEQAADTPLFWRVLPPTGWTRRTNKEWTTVKDERRVFRFFQCFSAQPSNTYAYLLAPEEII